MALSNKISLQHQVWMLKEKCFLSHGRANMASWLFRFALDFMFRFSLQIDTMHYDQSPTSTPIVNDTMHCDILKYQKLVDMNQWILDIPKYQKLVDMNQWNLDILKHQKLVDMKQWILDILKYQKLVDMKQWNLWSDIMHFVDDLLDFVLI